jgi:hypothetical protein
MPGSCESINVKQDHSKTVMAVKSRVDFVNQQSCGRQLCVRAISPTVIETPTVENTDPRFDRYHVSCEPILGRKTGLKHEASLY